MWLLGNAAMNIRPMTADIGAVADIHADVFPRQVMSREWIAANFSAFPRMQYFVAEQDGIIFGFVHWSQKSGFRRQVVLELEQIGVSPKRQGKGVGKALIERSLPVIRRRLAERGATVRHLIVATGADNRAQQLYRRVLGVEVEATIADLYSADEVLMVRRNLHETG